MGNLTVKENGEMINFISPNVSKITSFKVHFSPKQEGTGDPSPDNVREITGWNGVEGYGSGKNIFNGIMRKGNYNTTTGEFENTNWYTSELLPVKPNTKYAFVKDGELNFPPYSYQFNEQKQYISNTYTTSTKIVTTRNETKYIAITISASAFNNNYLDNFMICEGNNINAIRDITASIDWTEDVGTVYGGYVDLISGELVEEEKLWIKNTSEMNSTNSSFAGWRNSGIKSIIGETNTSFYLQILNIGNYYTVNTTGNYDNLYLPNSTYKLTQDEWKEKAIDVKIVAPLATPITHQLTPQQLSTLKGQNNFWSNADYVEIEYELIETFDIQKAKRKIILNQPHVESASGDLVTFDTDIKGKLKECKVYFSPVQEGEGDPSPDNVRNITGWNGVRVGLPDEYQEVEWIQSTERKQFILLPYGFEETDTVTITASIDTEYTKDRFIIAPATWNNNNNRFAMVGVFANVYCIGYGNHTTNYTRLEPMTNNDGDMHTWTFANKIFEITDLGLSIDVSDITFGGVTSNLKLFYGYNSNINGKLSYYKHVKLNGEVYEFIPCYRKSDDEIGLYDIKNHVFYTNNGTGSFLKGKDVNNIATNINWTDNIGTVYGGYVDVTGGELVVDRAMTTNPVWSLRNSDGDRPWIRLEIKTLFPPAGEERKKAREMIICSKARTAANTGGNVPESALNYGIWSYDMDTTRIYMPEGYTEADAQTYMENIQIVYPLAEPIHYQLTPQQLLTLKGINNVYSDANGQTEIKYWKH